MSWNPVLDKFIEIKNEFILHCEKEKIWDYGSQYNNSFNNCLSYWVWSLENIGHPKRHHYQAIINYLFLNEYQGMLLIKYKDLNIDWDIHNSFYKECRSVVIDIYSNELILTPFRKFFNINEKEETSLEKIQEKINQASMIEITDKIDGSMVSARWWKDKVVISGSQALDREKSFRLENYYSWISIHRNIIDMLQTYKDYTFIFEGVFPNDIHVVQYNEQMTGLHLLGMRRVTDGKELSYNEIIQIAKSYNVPHVKIFNMTFEQMYEDIKSNGREANEGEGYVIRIDNERFKCKYDSYRQIHRAIAKIVSPNAIIASIREGYWDDFYTKIPLAYKPQAKAIADDVFSYLKIFDMKVSQFVECVYKECEHTLINRKTFMCTVDKVVPKRYRGGVRAKFLEKDIDYLRGMKYEDIKDYLEFLTLNSEEE